MPPSIELARDRLWQGKESNKGGGSTQQSKIEEKYQGSEKSTIRPAKEPITGEGVKPIEGGEKEGGGETGAGKGVVNRI